MLIYFLLVIFPGIFLHVSSRAMELGLAAYALWLFGTLGGIYCAGLLTPGYDRSSGNHAAFGNARIFWFFVLLAIPSVTLTFMMFGRIPLLMGLSALFSDASDLSMNDARRMNTLTHRRGDTVYFGQGYLRQIYTVVSPVFLTALYVLKKESSSAGSIRAIKYMMLFLVFSAAANGQIWVAVNVILLFTLGHFMVVARASGHRSFAKLILRGAYAYCALLAFIFLYRYLQFLQGRQFDSFFLDTLRRIYQPGAIELFEIFPGEIPFRYGATWLNDLSGMLPGSVESFAYEVHYLVHGGGWGFTFSPGIVASTYVNFGFPGVILVGFLFSLLFTFIFEKLTRGRSAMRLAIAIYISLYFMLAMPGDLTSYVVCLTTAALMYFAYVIFNSVGSIFKMKRLRSTPVGSSKF
jgi:hypothetical protein